MRLGARWPCPTRTGRWSGGAVSSQAAGVESGNGLPVRTGSRLSGPPCQLGGRLPQAPSFLGSQVGELPAAVRGASVLAWPLRPTRRGGSRAGRVDRRGGADPCLPSRLQPPRLPPPRTGQDSPSLLESAAQRRVPCLGTPTTSPWQVGAPPPSNLVKISGWRGWARLRCLVRPSDGHRLEAITHSQALRPCSGLPETEPE